MAQDTAMGVSRHRRRPSPTDTSAPLQTGASCSSTSGRGVPRQRLRGTPEQAALARLLNATGDGRVHLRPSGLTADSATCRGRSTFSSATSGRRSRVVPDRAAASSRGPGEKEESVPLFTLGVVLGTVGSRAFLTGPSTGWAPSVRRERRERLPGRRSGTFPRPFHGTFPPTRRDGGCPSRHRLVALSER